MVLNYLVVVVLISGFVTVTQGIADFENELKTYQGGLKKEAYYFYKSLLFFIFKQYVMVNKSSTLNKIFI